MTTTCLFLRYRFYIINLQKKRSNFSVPSASLCIYHCARIFVGVEYNLLKKRCAVLEGSTNGKRMWNQMTATA